MLISLVLGFSLVLAPFQPGGLTQTTGRLMLQQRINANGNIYQVDYSQIGLLSGLYSFFPTNERGDDGTVLTRFLDAGLVTEKVSEISVPDASGDFEGSFPGVNGPHANECFYLYLTLTANTLPRMNGTYRLEHPRPCAGAGNENTSGTFTAELVAIDRLALHNFTPSLYGFSEGEVNIVTAGGLFLVGNVRKGGGSYAVNVEGKPPLQFRTIKKYSHDFAPSFHSVILGSTNFINGGRVTVDRLANLVLVSPVEAQASFLWHVDFNKPAQVITQTMRETGVGTVSFRKQPNGRWLVWNYSLK